MVFGVGDDMYEAGIRAGIAQAAAFHAETGKYLKPTPPPAPQPPTYCILPPSFYVQQTNKGPEQPELQRIGELNHSIKWPMLGRLLALKIKEQYDRHE